MLDNEVVLRTLVLLQVLAICIGVLAMLTQVWFSRLVKGGEYFLIFFALAYLFFLIYPFWMERGLGGEISLSWLGREGALGLARHKFQQSSLALISGALSVFLGSGLFLVHWGKKDFGGYDFSAWKMAAFLGGLGLVLYAASPWTGLVGLFFSAALVFVEERNSPFYYANQSALFISLSLVAAAFWMGSFAHPSLQTSAAVFLTLLALLVLSGIRSDGSPFVFLPLGLWLFGFSFFILKNLESFENQEVEVWTALGLSVVVGLRSLYALKIHETIAAQAVSAIFLAITLRLRGLSLEAAGLFVVSAVLAVLWVAKLRVASELRGRKASISDWPLYVFVAALAVVVLALPGAPALQALAALAGQIHEKGEPLDWAQASVAIWLLGISVGVFFREIFWQKKENQTSHRQLWFLLPFLFCGWLPFITGNLLGIPSTHWYDSPHAGMVTHAESLEVDHWLILYGVFLIIAVIGAFLFLRYTKLFRGEGRFSVWMRSYWVMFEVEKAHRSFFSLLRRFKPKKDPRVKSKPSAGVRGLRVLGRQLDGLEQRVLRGVRHSETALTETFPRALQLALKGSVSAELILILGGVLLLVLHFGLRMGHE